MSLLVAVSNSIGLANGESRSVNPRIGRSGDSRFVSPANYTLDTRADIFSTSYNHWQTNGRRSEDSGRPDKVGKHFNGDTISD